MSNCSISSTVSLPLRSQLARLWDASQYLLSSMVYLRSELSELFLQEALLVPPVFWKIRVCRAIKGSSSPCPFPRGIILCTLSCFLSHWCLTLNLLVRVINLLLCGSQSTARSCPARRSHGTGSTVRSRLPSFCFTQQSQQNACRMYKAWGCNIHYFLYKSVICNRPYKRRPLSI